MLIDPFSQRDDDQRRIFMDYAAGWQPNASSIHSIGVAQRRELERARSQVAGVLAVRPNEIIFTSGGTEANNMAILGAFRAVTRNNSWTGCQSGVSARPHIITSVIEHSSVLAPIRNIESDGIRISYLPVRADGVVDIRELETLISPETVLISIMHANNETGTLQPVREVGNIIRKYRLEKIAGEGGHPDYPLFHVDACQSAGYRSVQPSGLHADMLTISGCKVGGPQGTGALYVKSGTLIQPLIFGGGQEGGLRAGTEDVASQIEFARALVNTSAVKDDERLRVEELRQRMLTGLLAMNVEDTIVCEYNGSKKSQLPNIVNVSFRGIMSDRMVLELDALGIAVSAGSACHAGQAEYSEVIASMKGEELARGAVRFSMGKETRPDDIDIVLNAISDILRMNKNNGRVK